MIKSDQPIQEGLLEALQVDAEAIIAPPSLKDFEKYRITAEKYIPRVNPVFMWSGCPIVRIKNITVVSALPKAGKTAFISALIAGSINKDGIADIFPEITVDPNKNGWAVIVCDTEQSDDDQQDGIKTILKRAGLDTTPDFFLSMNIRTLSLGEYRNFTDGICQAANEEFGGIYAIFIDGGADYLASINDEEAANDIVKYFADLANRYNCPVITIIHVNPGTNKERGHFGSQLQRKCDTLITIEKKNGISIASTKPSRKLGDDDITPIHFKFNKGLGYHTQVDAIDPEKALLQKNADRIQEMATEVFGDLRNLRHKDAVNEIMRVKVCSESTAKSNLKKMEALGFVDKSGEFYHKGQGSNGVKSGLS